LHNEGTKGLITVVIAINNIEWKIKFEEVGKGEPVAINEKYVE